MAELTNREAYDLLRSFHAKQVKPFEKLPQALEAAIQVIEHDLPAAQKALEELNGRLATLRASAPEVEAEVRQAQARVKAAQDEAAAAEQSARQRIRQAEQAASARETELTRAFEHQGATLEREHATRREELRGEIQSLEAKKAKLDQQIAAIKAQF